MPLVAVVANFVHEGLRHMVIQPAANSHTHCVLAVFIHGWHSICQFRRIEHVKRVRVADVMSNQEGYMCSKRGATQPIWGYSRPRDNHLIMCRADTHILFAIYISSQRCSDRVPATSILKLQRRFPPSSWLASLDVHDRGANMMAVTLDLKHR
jgi:hypothetical protein